MTNLLVSVFLHTQNAMNKETASNIKCFMPNSRREKYGKQNKKVVNAAKLTEDCNSKLLLF